MRGGKGSLTPGYSSGQKRYRHSLRSQILISCLIFTIILCVITSLVSFTIFRNGMMTQYQSRIGDIIRLTLAQIDVPDLEACIETGTESPAFASLMTFMDQARQNCSLDYLVIIKPVLEEGTYDVIAVLSGLLPEERAGQNLKEEISIPKLGERTGSAYPADFLPVIYDDLLNRMEIKYSSSHTVFGSSFDGAVAIRNEEGEGIALLTAGFTVDTIENNLVHYLLIIFVCALLICFLYMVFISLWINRRIIIPIQKIEQSAGEFAKKSHTEQLPAALVLNRPDIHTGDELESLSDTLVTMSEDMKEYVEDLLSSAVKMENMRKEITRISDIAMRDALTDVESKHAFVQKCMDLNTAIAGGTASFGLLMVDVNNLKQINDTYGHEKGDLYLINNCRHICKSFPDSTVYRIGGDEFAAILERDDLAYYKERLFAFRNAMNRDASAAPWEQLYAASGAALYNADADDSVDAVLARADAAMYANKKEMKRA